MTKQQTAKTNNAAKSARVSTKKTVTAKVHKPATKTAVKVTAPKTDAKAPRLCLCGCKNTVAGKKSLFCCGHDGRLKGMLQNGFVSREALESRDSIKFVVASSEFRKLMDAAKITTPTEYANRPKTTKEA